MGRRNHTERKAPGVGGLLKNMHKYRGGQSPSLKAFESCAAYLASTQGLTQLTLPKLLEKVAGGERVAGCWHGGFTAAKRLATYLLAQLGGGRDEPGEHRKAR